MYTIRDQETKSRALTLRKLIFHFVHLILRHCAMRQRKTQIILSYMVFFILVCWTKQENKAVKTKIYLPAAVLLFLEKSLSLFAVIFWNFEFVPNSRVFYMIFPFYVCRFVNVSKGFRGGDDDGSSKVVRAVNIYREDKFNGIFYSVVVACKKTLSKQRRNCDVVWRMYENDLFLHASEGVWWRFMVHGTVSSVGSIYTVTNRFYIFWYLHNFECE